MKASPGRLADNTVLCKVTVLLKNTWPGEEKFKKMARVTRSALNSPAAYDAGRLLFFSIGLEPTNSYIPSDHYHDHRAQHRAHPLLPIRCIATALSLHSSP